MSLFPKQFLAISSSSAVLSLLMAQLVLSQPETTSKIISSAESIDLLEAFGLGVVQGLTEFLPISSTAHLKVVPVVLGWGDPGVAFTAAIQLGSIAAVLWYFWQDLSNIWVGSVKAIKTRNYKSFEFRLAVGIAIGTIPIVFFGLLIKKFIPDFDNSPLRSLGSIAVASMVMSLLLGVGELVGKRRRTFDNLTVLDGILMGVAQALALVPGVSRSGSTLTAGLFTGLDRATAARFSFLLGIPAITLAGLVELKDLLGKGLGNTGFVPLIVGIISAAIFSYLSIAFLLRFLQTKTTWVFIWYRLGFGLLILGAIAAGWLKNI
jgi:undecaprenyl-diphosphatase